jgi:hypothetical protein
MATDGERVQKTTDGEKQTDEGAKADSKVEPLLPPRELAKWGIGYVKRKLEERRAKRKQESPADRAARITALATFWIAGFTLVLAVLSGLTWWEIRTGGTDTHDLVIVAKAQAVTATAQAGSMRDFADRMKAQADGTKVIV